MQFLKLVGRNALRHRLRTGLTVLGLVIAPILEMSLRQSLIMSNGSWWIFFNVNERPIAAALLALCALLLVLATRSLIRSRKDWRNKLAEVEEGS